MTTATSPTLLVLAAGMGSRYGGLKQIEPVGPSGETIIDYSIYDAMRAGFGKLVFVIRKDIEEPFKEVVGARFEKRIAVDYVFQELDKIPAEFQVPAGRTKPWGTTQAILMTADVIHEPFAVINADDFYGAESYRVLAQQLQVGLPGLRHGGIRSAQYALGFRNGSARGVRRERRRLPESDCRSSRPLDATATHAKNTDGEGKVTMLTGDEPVSMNFWGFTPQVFGQLREHFKKFLEANGGGSQEGVLHSKHGERHHGRRPGEGEGAAQQ